MKHSGYVYWLLALFLVPFVPMASADPEVLPVSSSTVSLDPSQVYITWAPNPTPVSITLTGPAGDTTTITLSGWSCGNVNDLNRVVVFLDGLFSANGDCGGGTPPTISSNMTGTPVDGTWRIENTGVSFRNAWFVAHGKQIEWDEQTATQACVGGNRQQLWNWHHTTGAWQEPECTLIDPVDDGPQEDPNEARYFSGEAETPPAPGASIPWSVSTVGADAPDCTTEPWTFNAYGSWSGGDFNASITTRYYTVSGDQSGGTGSLADIPGAVSSGDEAQGNSSPGADTTTLLPYDNVLGTSYQFNGTRNGTTDHGSILYAPPGQCDEFEGLPDPNPDTQETDTAIILRYYPQDNEDMWLQGTSKRICDQTTNDITIEGNFNITFPDGTYVILPPGHDGCTAIPFTQIGYYTMEWTHDHPGLGGGTEDHTVYWHVHAGVVKPLSITEWPPVSMDGLVIENVTIGSSFEVTNPEVTEALDFWVPFLFWVAVMVFSWWRAWTALGFVGMLGAATSFLTASPIGFAGFAFLGIVVFFVMYAQGFKPDLFQLRKG